MTENLKKFLEEASKNEELKAKLAALTDKETAVEKTVEIAKEYGFTLTAEDFQAAEAADLSPDELEQVAGGVCVTASTVNDYVGRYVPFCKKCASLGKDPLKLEQNVGDPCSTCGTTLIEKYCLFKP